MLATGFRITQSLEIAHADLRHHFLGKLRNKVFHFTSLEAWKQIQITGCILPNQNNKFQQSSTQSSHSVGHFLNAVCLFDLRNRTEKQIERGLYLYDFLGLHRPKEKSYYFIIDPKYYSSLISLPELDEEIRKTKMYIPDIESWHIGPIDLSKISECYELSVFD